ncbi:MAG TPA: phasin family protein [Xanthobacteraceae bacterium]|jgi:hypothetical protein|nr:phasin family protein [Xanthobacteraceae bacterium]
MYIKLDEMQAFGKASLDATTSSLGACSKGFQAIATEFSDYSKKVFEDGASATEKLLTAKTPDKAFEVHGAYMKSTYEGFVAQSTKLGDLYASLARDVFKPYEPRPTKAASSK